MGSPREHLLVMVLSGSLWTVNVVCLPRRHTRTPRPATDSRRHWPIQVWSQMEPQTHVFCTNSSKKRLTLHSPENPQTPQSFSNANLRAVPLWCGSSQVQVSSAAARHRAENRSYEALRSRPGLGC